MEYLITAIAAFFMGFFIYRQGIKDGHKVDKGEELIPLIKLPKPAKKQTDEQKRVEKLLKDIDEYDGTPKRGK